MSLFALRGKLSKAQEITLGIIGLLIFIAGWYLLAELMAKQRPIVDSYTTRLPSSIDQDSTAAFVNLDSLLRADSINFADATEFEKVYPLLPRPDQVVSTYPSLIRDDKLASNTFRSIWLNLQGYFWAVIISLVLGMFIGLIPILRGLFSKQVDALRYLPLTALTGLFILWFGIEDQMKISFLAFGILVYLLPVVVQRIDEVEDVYLKTVFTLGATDWQTIKSVYLPSIFSKLIDDVRVLTAISWTYIIIAELLNRQGGVGALIYVRARQGDVAKVFAILIVIVLVGFIQDRIFVYLDHRLFPHKYYKTTLAGIKEVEYGIFAILGTMALAIILPIFFDGIGAVLATLAPIIVVAGLIIIIFGEFRLQKSLTE